MAYPLETKQKAFECYLMGYSLEQIAGRSIDLLGMIVPIDRLKKWCCSGQWVSKRAVLDRKTAPEQAPKTAPNSIENNLTGLEPAHKTTPRPIPEEAKIIKKVFENKSELLEWQNEIALEYQARFHSALKEGKITLRGSDLCNLMELHRENLAILKQENKAKDDIPTEILALPDVAEAMVHLSRVIDEAKAKLGGNYWR